MLAVIARESTALFGADNTSRWLRSGWQLLFGVVDDERWGHIHHIIRKSGHFLGYGMLGLSWLRAFLLLWMQWMIHRPARVWRGWCVAVAISCTALVASLDELHQSFLPNRTGVPQDVVLDVSGAVALMLIVMTFWVKKDRTR